MWLPICPPPVCNIHASARSQTSKNVKHVDARSGGRGEMLIRRPLGQGPASAGATPRTVAPAPLTHTLSP